MNKIPLVSVIIPTYNRAQALKRALESVIKQTHTNLEIIIVDDNSNDNTMALVNDFIEKDKRIIFLKNDRNKGNGSCRAMGMGASKGAFISFLDDDDEWLENKIDLQLKKAREINTPVLILCNGFDFVRMQRFSMDLTIPDGFIFFKKNKIPLSYGLPNPSHWFFSRAVFEKVGNFDASFRSSVDLDYLLRIFLNKIPIYYFNIPLVRRYRLGDKEYVSQTGEKGIHFKEQLLKKHYAVLSRDKQFIFRLHYSIGKDYLSINSRKNARVWFLKALKLRPYKVEIVAKILKAF